MCAERCSFNIPLVSVIVPVYNVEKYIDECLNSIIKQDYRNIEIIIIDDGSCDDSGMICEKYAKEDHRIIVIHTVNNGLSVARNMGIEKASGEYIAFVDSDDYVSPIFVSVLVGAIINNGVDVALLNKNTPVFENEHIELETDKKACDVQVMSNIDALKLMFYQKIAMGAQYKICKREVFKNIRFPAGLYYEDVATSYKMLLKSKQVAVVHGSIYAYRHRKNGIIRQPFNDKKMTAVSIRELIINDECLKQLGLFNAACHKIFQMILNVYMQVPFKEYENRKILWECIKVDRKRVLNDDCELVSTKIRLAAWFSYLGMNINTIIGFLYKLYWSTK